MIIIKKISLLLIMLGVLLNTNAQKNDYLLGEIDYNNGLYNSAISCFDKYIGDGKNYDKAFILRGKAKINIRGYGAGIEDIARVDIKQFPEMNLCLARAYAGLNQEESAIGYLKKYLKLKYKLPEEKIIDFPEFANIADSKKWELLWEQKWYTKKERLLHDAEYELNMKSYRAAESLLNKYVLTYKANPRVFYLKAGLAARNDNYKDAVSYLDKAIEVDSNVDYLVKKAQAEFHLKKYKKALKTCNDAYINDSLNLEIPYVRSIIYSLLNEHDLATADIRKYLYYYPDNVGGLERYAKISTQAGDFLSAIRIYGKLIKQDQSKPEYFKERANCYMATHTYRYAIKDYSMALDLYPQDAEVCFRKGNAHFKLEEIQKACSEWKHAYKYGSMESAKLIYKYCRVK